MLLLIKVNAGTNQLILVYSNRESETLDFTSPLHCINQLIEFKKNLPEFLIRDIPTGFEWSSKIDRNLLFDGIRYG
jgi:hypothetical protein